MHEHYGERVTAGVRPRVVGHAGRVSTPPSAGWYADPWRPGSGRRWWDGRQWTPHAELVADRPLADPGPRLVARLIDGLLVGVVVAVAFTVVFLVWVRTLYGSLGDSLDVDGSDNDVRFAVLASVGVFVLLTAVLLAIPLLYETLLVRRSGQTIGKRIAGVRVVRRSDNRPPSTGQSFLRALITALASGLYVDALWCLWDQPWRQCLHDKAVDTIVIPADAPWGDAAPVAAPDGPGPAQDT